MTNYSFHCNVCHHSGNTYFLRKQASEFGKRTLGDVLCKINLEVWFCLKLVGGLC